MDRTSKKSALLADTVKVFCITWVVLFSSCVEKTTANNASAVVPGIEERPWFLVKNTSLHLKDSEGKCIVFYKQKNDPAQSVSTDMSAPCDFLRIPGKSTELQSFTYGPTTILMIIGGPFDKARKDEYQPDGCGTDVRPLIINKGKITIGERLELGADGTVCPSQGLDEVFFGTVRSK